MAVEVGVAGMVAVVVMVVVVVVVVGSGVVQCNFHVKPKIRLG